MLMKAPAQPPVRTQRRDRQRPPCEILAPREQTLAAVFASPHSGRDYPKPFVRQSRLDLLSLRRSEDSFVDDIFAAAPDCGAPLLRALFPRVYVDPNREPYELDPEMFDAPPPPFAKTRSPQIAAGLGTVAKCISDGREIYAEKLPIADALRRIETLYMPYHRALGQLVSDTRARFGFCLLIDCHSMPSTTSATTTRKIGRMPEIVLGDRHGTSCAPVLIDTVQGILEGQGYKVVRNVPYAGGFTTQRYGHPAAHVHALQIEINRALYMDEARFEPTPGLATLAGHMRDVIQAVGAVPSASLPLAKSA